MKRPVILQCLVMIFLWSARSLFSMGNEEIAILSSSLSSSAQMNEAIFSGDLAKVKELIQVHKDVPEVLVDEIDKTTPLHLAIRSGQKEIFDYLIDETVFGTWGWINHATMVDEDEYDLTPLLACVKKDELFDHDSDIIHKLLVHGANINAQDFQDKGTAVWIVSNLHNYGEQLQLAQLLALSGADLSLTCKHTHNNRGYEIPRGCTPRERAKESNYSTIEIFLCHQEHLNFSLVERLEQESDPVIQENLYARAIFYEAVDVLWNIMELIKKCKAYSTMQNVENDVVKRLLKAEYVDRLQIVLEEGFFCAPDDIVTMKKLIAKHIRWQPNLKRRVKMAHDFYCALSVNRLTHHLKSFAYTEKFRDVIIYASSHHDKKRMLPEVLLPIAKKTK